jgi:hypothetical protein
MAVIPTFESGGNPSVASQGFEQGVNLGESMMDRAQRRQLLQGREERDKLEEDHKQAAYTLMQPVMAAKAQADLAANVATLANAKHNEELKKRAAEESVNAAKEFTDANMLADFDAKASALAEVQAKYSWMAMFPEYKGFVDTLNHTRAEAHLSAIADAKLEEQLANAQAARDARIEGETIKAGSRTEVATIGAEARQSVAETNADARIGATQITAKGRYDAAKLRADRAYAFEQAVEQRDEALANGDNEKAQLFQDHINAMNYQAPGASDRPLPKTAPKPKAKTEAAPAPVIVLPKAKVPPKITIEGQDYPVFKDKNGNYAYLKDGKYVDIEAQDGGE